MKIPEAGARLFDRMYVCLKCKSKIKANPSKVKLNKIRCRKCGYNQLRAKVKEKRVAK